MWASAQHGLCDLMLDAVCRRTILSETPMTARARILTTLLAVVICACGSDPGAPAGDGSANTESALPTGRPGGIGRSGGQTGGEAGIHCNPDVELQPLGFDEPSPLGYSAADILAGLRPSYAATFTYTDETSTALSLTLASDGASAAYAPGCSRNEIDVVVGWSTADGAFSETLHGKLFALSPDAATLDVELPLQDLQGSYARSHAEQLVPAPVSFSFQLEFAPSEAHGNVSALRGAPDAQDSLAIVSY